MRRSILGLIAPAGRTLSSKAAYGPSSRHWSPVPTREVTDLLGRLTERRTGGSAEVPALDPELAKCLQRMAAHKQSDLAWRLYSQLGAARVPLDRSGYTAFVKAVGSIGKRGLAERAKRIEGDLRAAGAYDPTDEAQTCALIQASANADCFSDADSAFRDACRAAQEDELKVSDKVVQFFIMACARAGQSTRALEVFEEHFAGALADKKRLRSRPAFVAVMNSFGSNGQLQVRRAHRSRL
jgi:hypothetical protein